MSIDLMALVGFFLSLAYGLVQGLDESLGPPWVLSIAFVGALVLARRRDRWGLVGTVVVVLVPLAYLAGGQFLEPITAWSFSHNAGFATYIVVALVGAAFAVVAPLWELWVRARHGGRLPAAAGKAG